MIDVWTVKSCGAKKLVLVWAFSIAFPVFGQQCGNWEWLAPKPFGSAILDMVWTGTEWFAVGHTGHMSRSADGETWIDVSYPTDRSLYSVWYDGTLFVTGGYFEGMIMSSTDGINWQVTEFEEFTYVYDLVGNGSIYVATAGDYMLRSVDGVNWTMNSVSVRGACVEWTGTHFVSAGSNGISISTDGLVWEYRPSGYFFQDIHWNGTMCIAVGWNGEIYTSLDMINWDERISGTGRDLLSITYDGTKWWAGGADVVLSSADGIDWSPVTSVPVNSFFTFAGMDGSGQLYLAGTSILRTTNGTEWTVITQPLTHLDFWSVASNGVTLVAVGQNGVMFKSTDDGQTWFDITGPTTYDLEAITSNGTSFVAAGQAGTVVYSTNGSSWTVMDISVEPFTAATYWQGRYYVVGDDVIFRSANGVDWDDVSPVFLDRYFLEGVGGNDDFIATGGIGGDYDLLVSYDGLTWIEVTDYVGWNYCVAGNDDLVVIGSMYASYDGSNWFDVPQSVAAFRYEEMIWTGEQFVAIGNKNAGINTAVATSSDGLVWTEHFSNITDIGYGLVMHKDKLIMVGTDGMIAQSSCRLCGLLIYSDWPSQTVIEFLDDLCD